MRLINVHTLELHEFMGSQLSEIRYVILSHTWGEEEVTFQEMQHPNRAVRKKEGYLKILNAANQAKVDGRDWLWVDTCCIDKTSSAELSEAINSMYMWYRRSIYCYAYLVDVGSKPAVDVDPTMFMQSRWFTRGWTLQELIAPRIVDFFAKDWVRIGTTALGAWSEKGKSALCRASGVPYDLLFGNQPLERYSIAQRMSWASGRICTRVEDMAYCLLGLFDINMPLLYGEGERAFIRLQEEIIRSTDDHSIYAWTMPQEVHKEAQSIDESLMRPHAVWTPHPILAPSPRYFSKGGNVIVTGGEEGESGVTKHGVKIQLFLEKNQVPIPTFASECLGTTALMSWARLNCRLEDQTEPLGLVLAPIRPAYSKGPGSMHFYRLGTTEHLSSPMGVVTSDAQSSNPTTTVYIRQKISSPDAEATRSNRTVRFEKNIPVQMPGVVARVSSNNFDDLVFLPGFADPTTVSPSSWRVTAASPRSVLEWSQTFEGITFWRPYPRLFVLHQQGLNVGLLLCIMGVLTMHMRPKLASVVVELDKEGKWRSLKDVVGHGFLNGCTHLDKGVSDAVLGTTTVRTTFDCVEHKYDGKTRLVVTASFDFEDCGGQNLPTTFLREPVDGSVSEE